MPIDQPFAAWWSPSTTPLATPDPVALGKVYDLVIERGRGPGFFDTYSPGTASVKVRNGARGASSPDHAFSDWRRWTRTGVTAAIGGGWDVFSGHILQFDHDVDDLPFAQRVSLRAVDAMGVWTKDYVDRELVDAPESLLGFATTSATLAAEIDAASTGIGSLAVAGDARAPVTLPATFVDDAGVRTAQFREQGLVALKKSLDVEMGTVHVDASGGLVVNGRYAVPDTFVEAGGVVFTLSDDLDNGYPFLRGSLKFADPISEYHNHAVTAGLRKKTHTAGTPDAGDPPDAIDFDGLWCGDENWVEANARHLAKLYAGVKTPWPAEVSVVVWNTAMDDFTLSELVFTATAALGRYSIGVEVHDVDGNASTWVCTVEGIRLTVTSTQAVATLRLGAGAARWTAAYDLSVGIFALGSAGRGLGSGAILGP